MNALELAKRLGAAILNNKLRHPDTGVVLARFEDAELVLTPEGEEVAASLPAAKTPRAAKAAAVESAPVATAEASVEAPSAPETAPE